MSDTTILLLVLVSMGIVFALFAAYQARFRRQMFHRRRAGVAKWSALACGAAALVVVACIVAANAGIGLRL